MERVLLSLRPWMPARWTALVVACLAMGAIGWRGALGPWSYLLLPVGMLVFVAVSSRWVAVQYDITERRVVRRIGNLERAWRRDEAQILLEGRTLLIRGKDGKAERVPLKDPDAVRAALGLAA